MKNKKSILGSSAAIVTAAALLAGGTFAAFSDYDDTATNTVGAGFLEVSIGNNNQPGGGGPLFNTLNLAPGESREAAVFVASTDGDGVPNAKMSVELVGYEGEAGPCSINSNGKADAIAALGGDCDDLGDGLFDENAVLLLSSWEPTGFTTSGLPRCGSNTRHEATKASARRIHDHVKLADAVAAGKTEVPGLVITPGAHVCLGGTIELPNTVGNEVMGDTGDFEIRVHLDQIPTN